MAEKQKTVAECRKEYETLARQVAELAAKRPKVQVEIERRVKAELGDFDKQFADLKARKATAALAMFAAEEREKPEQDAKAKAVAEAKLKAEAEATARANAQRKADEAKALQQRLAEAAKR